MARNAGKRSSGRWRLAPDTRSEGTGIFHAADCWRCQSGLVGPGIGVCPNERY